MFVGFRENLVPVLMLEEVDQKRPGKVPQDGTARGHSMGPFNHVGRRDIHKAQEIFKELLCEFSRVVPFPFPLYSSSSFPLLRLSRLSALSDFATWDCTVCCN